MIAYPSPSCISEKPGPLVAVITLLPVSDAPMIAQIEAISSSICMNFAPFRGRRTDISSAISVEGVMGYPAKKSSPAYRAASTQASFPWTNVNLSPISFLIIPAPFVPRSPDPGTSVRRVCSIRNPAA
jgi:hypothetical protein